MADVEQKSNAIENQMHSNSTKTSVVLKDIELATGAKECVIERNCIKGTSETQKTFSIEFVIHLQRWRHFLFRLFPIEPILLLTRFVFKISWFFGEELNLSCKKHSKVHKKENLKFKVKSVYSQS